MSKAQSGYLCKRMGLRRLYWYNLWYLLVQSNWNFVQCCLSVPVDEEEDMVILKEHLSWFGNDDRAMSRRQDYCRPEWKSHSR